MINYLPPPPESGNSHQISARDDPDSIVARSRVWRTIGMGLLVFAEIAGLRWMFASDDWLWQLIGFAVTLGAGVWLVILGRAPFDHFRRMYRLARDRCTNCGQSTAHNGGIRCPECGCDPFAE